MDSLNQKTVDAMRQALLAERESLNETARTSAESRKPVTLDQQSVGRLSRMDALQMQAMAVASDRRRQVRLQQIEAALGRIEEREFGYCVVCGYEIEEGRLKNDPAMPSCITCASARS
jgi:DnaK suppressor protein